MGAVTRNAGADTVVMGRMMDQRVHPYSNAHGYSSYNALPQTFYNFTNRQLPPPMHDQIHHWANKKWINYQMMQGNRIVDIGAPSPALNPRGPGALSPSDYYDMERSRVGGYASFSVDPQPAWDLRP